ncbi:MAG: 3-dehydroquinate synthase [Hyphomonadaceae bacterium]
MTTDTQAADAGTGRAPSGERRVRVELGSRAYDIVIGSGLLARAGELIRTLTHRKRVFVVADRTVAGLHLATLEAGLAAGGFGATVSLVDPGEGTKRLEVLERVLDEFIEAGAERDDVLVAFGGGVVGDLTGLAAGLLKRGARFVQIPTTLLAQVDSSVGGKTAVNSRAGKNLIGLFHQPALVISDLDVLSTLPARERSAGLAEVAKYALIGDTDFLAWLEANAEALRAGEPQATGEAVRISCEAKARVVAADETEKGQRALLNLGHTFGHALERANGFGPALLHGEAVGAGMAMAMRFSVRLGLCPEADAARAGALLNALGLVTRIPDLSGGPYVAEELLAHMGHDKKNRDGRMTLILARGAGEAFVQPDADEAEVLAFLRQTCAA